MHKLFIEPDAEIVVKIWFSLESEGSLKYWFEEEAWMKKTTSAVSILEAIFREPNFKDTSQLSDLALSLEQDGSFSMSINQVRMERVSRLLKKWTMTDSQGNSVKLPSPDKNSVEKLNPTIAIAIAEGLERQLGISKNSETAG